MMSGSLWGKRGTRLWLIATKLVFLRETQIIGRALLLQLRELFNCFLDY